MGFKGINGKGQSEAQPSLSRFLMGFDLSFKLGMTMCPTCVSSFHRVWALRWFRPIVWITAIWPNTRMFDAHPSTSRPIYWFGPGLWACHWKLLSGQAWPTFRPNNGVTTPTHIMKDPETSHLRPGGPGYHLACGPQWSFGAHRSLLTRLLLSKFHCYPQQEREGFIGGIRINRKNVRFVIWTNFFHKPRVKLSNF